MTNLTQVLIQKAGGKLFLNGEEIGPGTIDVSLDGLTYRASEKVEVEQPEQEPIGWLDGADMMAEFLHRDMKAAHDRCGSATPREFTIPVYLAPPAAQPEHGDIRALKYRIHELEGEVIGYKRMIEEAALKKLADLGQQIEQEPVAWMYTRLKGGSSIKLVEKRAEMPEGGWSLYKEEPLYTTPQAQRPWVGLTASTILNMMPESIPAEHDGALMEFARDIEAKLKEKKT